MSEKFVLSCESTVDFPYSYISSRHIPVIFYSYIVDGVDYVDDMGRDPEALPRFYKFLENGKLPSTSQINTFRYSEFFESILSEGHDLLHIGFGSKMTPSVNNAIQAGEMLREKYPERKIIVIDSTCSSSGYGMLVDYAADMRDNGDTIEDTAQWVYNWRKRLHHQFYSTDLTHFRRSGRMSGAAASIATILNICPIMRLDNSGKIIAYDKVRGRKNAIKRTINMMLEHAVDGSNYSGKCFICHSNNYEDAVETQKAVMEHFPNVKEPPICDIGTIIASHSGPGTVAVFFLGDERAPE